MGAYTGRLIQLMLIVVGNFGSRSPHQTTTASVPMYLLTQHKEVPHIHKRRLASEVLSSHPHSIVD